MIHISFINRRQNESVLKVLKLYFWESQKKCFSITNYYINPRSICFEVTKVKSNEDNYFT